MSIARHHIEWLTLVPNSGPFLSLPVLTQAFPQGLDARDTDHARRLRMAWEEWDADQLGDLADPRIHRAWVKFVLEETLAYEGLLAEGQEIPQTIASSVAEYGETLRPDWIVNDPSTKKVRFIVQIYPRMQSLTKPVQGSRWKTSPDTRMMQLLHDTGIRLGIVTNGEHWMLVNAPKSETTGYVSWHASLWSEEPITLRAFHTVLCADRLFSVPDDETLEALLDRSASDQQEVTDQLGYQVRKAVEVLIQALDKADQEHGRKLLAEVDEKLLYESALTVMMRLVFLFCAEERGLLLLGDELYDRNYAVSTLREQLRATADQHGEEILGLRHDTWPRLLTVFRAVYSGVKHDRFKLPAYGGSLFDPDRFPFLEGRPVGTRWKDTQAAPLPVSNRTVLHLLEALQVLQVRLPGGGTAEARRLSFRELDIEQIGHVYEGLLDHTAKRATEPVLGLRGTKDKEPEVPLSELERLAAKGETDLLKFLNGETGRSVPALKNALNEELDGEYLSRLRTVGGGASLSGPIEPFAGLIREDTTGYPVVINKGSVFVTAGTDRRSSGTHYTPRSLTEPIVQHTLEPLVYVGPTQGLPKKEWKLRSANELLDLKICDMACGSGAFLVQACRYMAERLLEAWGEVQRGDLDIPRITPEGQASTGKSGEMILPADPDERQTWAMRIVVQRCLYGVDKNPLAVEMAKLSLWLLTLAKDRPFEFLDHAIRQGDSLVGLNDLEQLRRFGLKADPGGAELFKGPLDRAVEKAINLRLRLESASAVTIEDIEQQERLLSQAEDGIAKLRCAADLLVSAEFWAENASEKNEKLRHAVVVSADYVDRRSADEFADRAARERQGQEMFHWPLEFPEVIVKRGGFDAFVGNPPFITGTSISTILGDAYKSFLKYSFLELEGRADLCVVFMRRAVDLLRDRGTTGFLGSDSTSEGDSRISGPGYLLRNGCSIIRAVKSQKWPGTAAVRVCQCFTFGSKWGGKYVLNGKLVECINSSFDVGVELPEPYTLSLSKSMSFTGTKVYGSGFVLSIAEGNQIRSEDPRNRRIVKRYMIGRELNNVKCEPGRYVIDFTDMAEADASTFEAPWRIVEQRVYEKRQTAPEIRMRERWWEFQRPRRELYDLLARRGSGWVIAATSDTVAFVAIPYRVEDPVVFSHALNVLALDGFGQFAAVQSSIHLSWARKYGSSMRGDMRYTTTDCFENYPFPSDCSTIDEIGQQYYEARKAIAENRQVGLTDLYHCFHDPEESSSDIRMLRELHAQMDQQVAAAYDWNDLELGHGFVETAQRTRYTICENARYVVLQNLLELNHERHERERRQELHGKKKPKSKKTKESGKSCDEEPTLFDLQ